MSSPERLAGASCWIATAAEREVHPPLTGEARADVAVVGGGIVGVTTALMLQRAGRSVLLLEARRIGHAVTGGSTGKVTSQHGLIYNDLEQRYGREGAARYARSNEAGREWIAAQAEALGIDCDLETRPAFVYAHSDQRVPDLEREAEAAQRAGLPAALARDDVGLPFPVRAAVRFDGQAQIHPVRYVAGLAADFVARGGTLHEATRVIDVDYGRPCSVITAHGRVQADEVVVATNIPVLDRGGFFGRAFPYRHMAVAGPVVNGRDPGAMYISADQPTRSLRTAPWTSTERLLVLIGEAFPTGHADTAHKLAQLETFAGEHFGLDAQFRWGNQDYYAADRVPYVGPILPGLPRIRVATGFNAWGITTGTAAAIMLSDMIQGRDNEWTPLYDSRRIGWRGGAASLMRKNAAVAAGWLAERLEQPPAREPATIRPGEGEIVRVDGRSAAAFRDDEGVLHLLDARCTHMGCRLRFNAAERSWDCHCHGSRFDIDGAVLNGPAVRGLAPFQKTE